MSMTDNTNDARIYEQPSGPNTALRKPGQVGRHVGEDGLRRDHEKGGERIESDEARAVRDANGKEQV